VNRKIFWFVVTILVLSILTNLIISKKITFAKIANLFSKKNGQTQLSQKDPYNAPAPKFIWGVGIMTTPTNVRDAGVLEQLLQDAKNWVTFDDLPRRWPNFRTGVIGRGDAARVGGKIWLSYLPEKK